MKKSLQSRIIIAMWTMTTLSMLAAGFFTASLLIRSHREAIKHQLEASATSLISLGISDFSELEDFEEMSTFIEDTLQMEKAETSVRVYNRSKDLVFTTFNARDSDFPKKLEITGKRPTFLTINLKKRQYESLILPYLGGKKKHPFYLQVIIPLPKYSKILRTLWWRALGIFVFLIGIALFISRQLAKKLIRPVGSIADHLEQMDPSRIEDWHPLTLDEKGLYLGAIIHGINSLTERTRTAVLQIRKMGHYVAHELRTPLTVLQGEAETILSKNEASKEDYTKVLKSSLEEIEHMSETITTILQVGESERRSLLFRPISFDPAGWIRENKYRWEKTLGRPIRFEYSPRDSDRIRVDPKLLYHLLDNLVRNIRKHTPPATTCTLSLFCTSQGVRIYLEDNGPGMPASLIEALNKKSSSLEDVGVGLNLCQKIADICHLRLSFLNKPEGGLRIELTFH